tara:strand:+ start:1370 stop:1585 length:216 start_codon:yes stop_codon:yes gene_type:complete
MTKDEEIKLLRKNISDLQEQVQNCYIRIKELTDEKTVPDGTGHGPAMVDIDDGWADETDIQIMSTSRGHNQ